MHIEEDSIKNFSGHDSMDTEEMIAFLEHLDQFLRLTILQNRSFKGQRPLTFRLPELYAAPPEKCSSFIMDFAQLQE